MLLAEEVNGAQLGFVGLIGGGKGGEEGVDIGSEIKEDNAEERENGKEVPLLELEVGIETS